MDLPQTPVSELANTTPKAATGFVVPNTSGMAGMPQPIGKNFRKIRLLGIVLGIALLFFSVTGALAYEVASGNIDIHNPVLQAKIAAIVFRVPFLPKTPQFLLLSAALAQSNVAKSSFDASVAYDANQLAVPVGFSSFDGELKGYLNYANPKNVQFLLHADIGKDFSADARKGDSKIYFRILSLPPVVTTLLRVNTTELNSVLDNWVVYDTAHLQTPARQTLESATPAPQSQSVTNDFIQKTLNDLNDPTILKAIQVSSDSLGQYSTYKLHLSATSAMIDLIAAKVQQGQPKSTGALYQVQPTKLSDSLKDLRIDTWIDKDSYYVRKISLTGSYVTPQTSNLFPSVLGIHTNTPSLQNVLGASTQLPGTAPKQPAKFAIVVTFDNFGRDVQIITPPKAISFSDFLKQLLATSSYADQTGLDSASSRNSRRLSDLGTLRKALDLALANAKTSTKPFTPNTTSSSCSGTTSSAGTGWISYNKNAINLQSYITTLPQDPTNSGVYCYQFKVAANGFQYKLTATLEPTSSSAQIMKNDGGIDPNRYEVGPDLSIK